MQQEAHSRRGGAWPRRQHALLVLALLLTLAIPAVIGAHPLGNFTINHYSRLELAPGQVRIFYVLDMAEIPTFQTMQEVDGDGDSQVSSAEGAAFATAKIEELRRGLRLTFDGTAVELTPTSPDLTFPPGQGGLALLRLTFWLEGVLPIASQNALVAEYTDTNDAGRIGWKEIVVRGQGGLSVLESTVSDRDRSNELRNYPVDMLSSPLNQTSATFSFRAGSDGAATGAGLPARGVGTARNDGAFAALIAVPNLTTRVMLLALLTAMGLGALHGLEPGHGKTVAAAYLVGARATARHALALGLTITGMHTVSVFVLGLVTLFASRYILPERLLPWFALLSGLIVIAIGARMFVSRLRMLRTAPAAGPSHAGMHDHDHPLTHDHPHSHEHGHDHTHAVPQVLAGGRVSWQGVLAIGVSGGLVPCPAALIVLLSAIGLGRVGFGLLLIVAFSAGLALALSGIGLLVLYGGRWLSSYRPGARLAHRTPGLARLATYTPALSGLLVVAAGLLLLYQALPLLRAL